MLPNMTGQSPKTDKAIKSGVTFVTPLETILEMASERWKKLAADHDAAIVAVGRRQDIGSAKQFVESLGLEVISATIFPNLIDDIMVMFVNKSDAWRPKINLNDYFAQYVHSVLTPAGIKKYLHNVISDRMDIYKRANGFFTGTIGPKANSFDYYYSEAEAILQIVDAIPVAEPEKPQPEQ